MAITTPNVAKTVSPAPQTSRTSVGVAGRCQVQPDSSAQTNPRRPDLYGSRWQQSLFADELPDRMQSIDQSIDDHFRTKGLPLIGVWRDEPPLFNAAKKHFGTWHNALRAAGLPAREHRTWSREKVLATICAIDNQGQSLARVWRTDKPLFQAAVRYFGNWENAMRAAGQDPRPRRRWTRDQVIDELLAWHHTSVSTDLRHDDPALAGAASRLFGSIDRAFEAAGIEPKGNRWTDRRVIERIQDYYLQRRSIAVNGCGDRRLFAAAKRRFGSWANAVAAAGLSDKYAPPAPTRVWSRQEVLAAIRKWHEEGRPITNVCKQDQGLYSVAKKHFGCWRQAVIAAGLQPTRRQWTRQLVLEEIRRRKDRGLPLNSLASKQDPPLTGAAIRLFGSWRQALLAAGIDSASPGTTPGKMNMQKKGQRDVA